MQVIRISFASRTWQKSSGDTGIPGYLHIGKRQGQRNSSYLRSFTKGGQKRSLTACTGLGKTHCRRSVCRKAKVGQRGARLRHLTNCLPRETEPWRAEPCNPPSPPLNITKAWCITGNMLIVSEVQQLRKNPVHFFFFPCGFMPCTKYGSKLHILKAFYWVMQTEWTVFYFQCQRQWTIKH